MPTGLPCNRWATCQPSVRSCLA